MAQLTQLEKAIQQATGESVQSLRDMPIAERRKKVEERIGGRVRFISHWPFVGSGNVNHGMTLSRDEVECELSEALS